VSYRLVGVVVFALSVFAIIVTVRLFKRDRLSARLLFMWVALWCAIGFFALYPHLLDVLMGVVRMGNRMFFLTTTAILILYAMIFHITSSQARTDKTLTKLAREMALMNHRLEELKDKP
jgi:hypothetical protein